jgi:hypothetical protein
MKKTSKLSKSFFVIYILWSLNCISVFTQKQPTNMLKPIGKHQYNFGVVTEWLRRL